MAIAHYESVNGIARKVTKAYDSVNGVARNRVKAYDGVDGVARLFFAPESNEPVVLEVKKITSNTYANDTAYENEEFILLDIYPKTGGTVNVTYGGLTKTITDTSGAESPNAQQVFFGTLYGVSDSVETPSSGRLTIEGAYRGYGIGVHKTNSKGTLVCCYCITNVIDMGNPEYIGARTFYGCRNFALTSLPDSIIDIGADAFAGLPWRDYWFGKSLATIGEYAFYTLADDTADASSDVNRRKFYFDGCIPKIADCAFAHDDEKGGYSVNSWTELHYQNFNNRWDEWAMVGGYNREGAFTSHGYAIIDGVDSKSIKSVILTDKCTEIADYAFCMFNSMTAITISASVTKIGAYGIYIYGSPQVEMLSTEPPSLGSNAFCVEASMGGHPTIIVPKGCGDAYKAAEKWSTYADYIVEAT